MPDQWELVPFSHATGHADQRIAVATAACAKMDTANLVADLSAAARRLALVMFSLAFGAMADHSRQNALTATACATLGIMLMRTVCARRDGGQKLQRLL